MYWEDEGILIELRNHGEKNSIIGRSHECDFPIELNKVVPLTSPKLNVTGSSREIHDQIEGILSNSLSVYKVDIEKLKLLNPDYVITQAQCEVCAVSLSEVEKIISKYLSKNTKVISLQPNNDFNSQRWSKSWNNFITL